MVQARSPFSITYPSYEAPAEAPAEASACLIEDLTPLKEGRNPIGLFLDLWNYGRPTLT